LADLLITTWHNQLSEVSLDLGWQTHACAFHVSAKSITQDVPQFFLSSMKQENPD
jgi:hypothetical protein